jgi:uncharacterized membrane protein YkgB
MERDERGNVVAVIVIGFIVGVLTSAFGYVITGGGHGLVTALFTVSSVVLAPVAFAGVRRRRHHGGTIAIVIAAVIGIGIDIAICIEGSHDRMFARVWNAAPAPFAIWTISWLAWQFVVFAALVRPLKVTNE